MIDDFPKPVPGMDARMDKLVDYQQCFETIVKVLRTERGFRAVQLKAALSEERTAYWQNRLNEVQTAIDALVRMKDIGKLALMESKLSVVEELVQQPLLDGAAGDPKRLGY